MKKEKQKIRMMRKCATVFMILIMLFIPIETSYSLSLNNVAVTDVSDRYAIVNWQSDKDSSTTIKYGTNATQLTQTATSAGLTTNHTLLLSSLASSTVYYFNASSANGSESATSTTQTFTTTAADTTPPFIGEDLPEFSDSTTLRIHVNTEPSTQVYIYVNGVLDPSGFDNTSTDGLATFNAIRLQVGPDKLSPNEVKIVAIDPAGNRNEVTKIVTVDTTPPGIIFNDPLPLKTAATNFDPTFAFGDGTMAVSGDSDEPAEMEVSVDGVVTDSFNISSPWQTTVNFPTDKRYAVRFYAVDHAGNVFDQTFTVIVDRRAPSIVSTNFDEYQNGQGQYASFTLDNTISGKVNKPGMTILVFINNKTTSQASGLNIPGSLGEIAQRVDSGTLFGKDLDYVTTSGDDGSFSVDIEFQTLYSLSDADVQSLKFDTGNTYTNTVEIVAIDSVGRRISSGVKTIYYTRCGSGGFFTVGSPQISPNALPEPVLQQGAAQFSLTVPFTWNGPVAREKVDSIIPKVYLQPLNQGEKTSGKYNLSYKLFDPSKLQIFPPKVNPGDNQIYALVSLNKLDYDFGKDVSADNIAPFLHFPFILELSYNYEEPGTTKRSPTVVQKTCVDVAIQVDRAFFGFNQFRPSGFLRDTANKLDSLVKAMTDIDKKVRDVEQYAIYACGASIGINFFWGIGKTLACAKTPGADIRNSKEFSKIVFKEDGGIDCSTIENADDKSCCESSASLQGFQTDILKTICDRIFCPSVPTFDKQIKSYSDLFVTKTGIGVKSDPASASKCKTSTDTSCKNEFLRAWGKVVLIDWPYHDEYDMAQKVVASKTPIGGKIAEKAGDVVDTIGTSFVSLDQFSSNVCSAQTVQDDRLIGSSRTVNIGGVNSPVAFCVYSRPVLDGNEGAFDVKLAYGSYAGSNLVGTSSGNVQPTTTQTAAQGTTQTQPATTSSQPAQIAGINLANVEPCSAIKSITGSGTAVFTPLAGYEDIVFDRSTGACFANAVDCQKAGYAGCSDSDVNKCREALTGYLGPSTPRSGTVKLPPDVFAAIGSQYSKDYVYNPSSGIISSVRSVCLPAVDGYMRQYATVMDHISKCFRSIADTGKGNAGSCNSLISTVVCDLIVDALRCAGNIATKWAQSPGTGKTDNPNELPSDINIFRAVTLAGQSTADTIAGSYGDSASYQALFNENKLLHSVCIGAFTGDWDANFMSDMLSQSFQPHLDSTCVIQPATRRFVTANPTQSGKPTYLYYAGGMFVAGSDISRFTVELVCSNDYSCTQYPTSSNPSGKCDCFGKGEQRRLIPFPTSNMKSGASFDDAQYMSLNDEWRYDKVVMTYSYKDSNNQDITKTCESRLADQSTPPNYCSWQEGIGFRCLFNLGDRGYAHFVDTPGPIHDQNSEIHVYQAGKGTDVDPGEPLRLSDYKINVVNPKDSTGKDIPKQKYLYISVKNQLGQQVWQEIDRLDTGVNSYSNPNLNYNIKQSDFGTSAVPDIRGINAGGFTQSSATASTNIGAYDIITFPAAGQYQCNKLNPAGTLLSPGQPLQIPGNNLILCDGVSFSLSGDMTKIDLTPTISPTLDVNQLTTSTTTPFTGTAFIVKYAPSAQNVACDSEPKIWSVSMGIYDSDDSGKFAAGTLVYADGKFEQFGINEASSAIKINVRCQSPVGAAVSTGQAVINAHFALDKSAYSINDKINVLQYQVTAQQPIHSVALRLIDSKGENVYDVPLASVNGAFNFQGQATTVNVADFGLPLHVNGAYTAVLVINSNPDGTEEDGLEGQERKPITIT